MKKINQSAAKAAVNELIERQRQEATGQRKELLMRSMTGERKLLETVVYPAFGGLEGIILEYPIISLSGVQMFIDAMHLPFRAGLECDGYIPHNELMTRDRFSFEKKRIRTLAMLGIKYIPFSYDELDKHPEMCQRNMLTLIGKYGKAPDTNAYKILNALEREVIRYGMLLGRPLKLQDICYCLGYKQDKSRTVIQSLLSKGLLTPEATSTIRHHKYLLSGHAVDLLLGT